MDGCGQCKQCDEHHRDESGERGNAAFAVDDGQKIRALGFINEDFVYGMANDSDILKDISGNEVFAMHTVRIVSIDGNVKKSITRTAIM